MAKKGGIFSAFRNLFRFAIWTLAGVLVAALWFNWQAGDDVAVVEPDVVAEPEVVAPESVVENVVEEAAEDVSEPVSDVVEEIVEDVEEAVAEGAEGVQAVEDMVEDMVETVEDTAAVVEEGVVDAVEEAAENVADAALPDDPKTITIPGTDTSFTLINAFRRDNGSIEVTTEQTAGGSGATLWLVTCAPLAVGEIATGPSAGALSARTEDPEMTEISLADPRAMIAATACGVMR